MHAQRINLWRVAQIQMSYRHLNKGLQRYGMINVLIVEKTKTQAIEDIYVNLVAINWKKLDITNLAALRKRNTFQSSICLKSSI